MGITVGYSVGLLVALWVGPPSSPSHPQMEEVTLHGKVLTLTSALQALGVEVKADPESTDGPVVLLGEDRSITPLFRDDASRALFLDERLRGCRAEIRGRRFAGVPYLQVTLFQVERDGRLQTPEYYCNVCSITVRYPQTCPCCQGPMELRLGPDHR
jgi:hypothetical protein